MPSLPSGGVRYFRKFLFDVPTTEDSFAKGIIRDVERWVIPDGGVYDMFDFMVDGPGRVYKRGGTEYQSNDLTPTSPVTDGVLLVAVMSAEFPTGARILAIASNGAHGRSLFDVSGSSAVHVHDNTGANEIDVQPYENPSMFTDGTGTYMIVVDSQNAAVVPRKIYLDTGVVKFRPMVGNPPWATVSASHPPYFVLANGYDGEGGPYRPNRIWFSRRGLLDDPTDNWQVNGINASWLDLDEPIIAMTSFGGALLVWTRKRLFRISGDYAPGDESFNMGLTPVSSTGCIDARSIVKGTAGVYFANENGIFVTDGASVSSITETNNGGISFMWREEYMTGYSPQLGHVVAMGLYQDMYLFVTVTKVGESMKNLICFLPNLAWVKANTPMSADMYATSLAGPEGNIGGDIYLASPFGTGPTTCRVVKASGILTPLPGNKNDADGTPVLPTLTTRAYVGGSLGLKRFGFGHLSYQLNSGSSPTLTVSLSPGLETTGVFTEVHEGSPLPKTDNGLRRRRFRIYKDSQGMSFQIAQTGPSDETEIYSLELEVGGFFQSEGE